MEQNFSFAGLLEEFDVETIPVPYSHKHNTCALCGNPREECVILKKDPLPLEKAVQIFVERHTHVRGM